MKNPIVYEIVEENLNRSIISAIERVFYNLKDFQKEFALRTVLSAYGGKEEFLSHVFSELEKIEGTITGLVEYCTESIIPQLVNNVNFMLPCDAYSKTLFN